MVDSGEAMVCWLFVFSKEILNPVGQRRIGNFRHSMALSFSIYNTLLLTILVDNAFFIAGTC